MSDMEQDAREFLLKIASTISLGLLWMLINSTLGIGLNFAFFKNRPGVGNIIFYIWFISSFIALIVYIRRKWKL
jgi:hypothetical protein